MSLASFYQAGSESSVITNQIAWNNTIIILTYLQFIQNKKRMRFTWSRKKVFHMFNKTGLVQYKYPISANRQTASNWWWSWMWGMAAPDS